MIVTTVRVLIDSPLAHFSVLYKEFDAQGSKDEKILLMVIKSYHYLFFGPFPHRYVVANSSKSIYVVVF